MDDLSTLRQAWDEPAPPSQQAYLQARAALLDRAAGQRPVPQPRRSRPPRLAIRLATAGGLTMAMAAGLTVVLSVGGTDSPDRPTSVVPGLQAEPVANAVQALERAAVAAESRPFTPPRPDQWLYTEERRTPPLGRRPGASGPLPIVERVWFRADGTQRAWIENGRLRVVMMPQAPKGRPLPDEPWQGYANLSRLPTDPQALLRLAYRMFRPDGFDGDPDAGVYTLFNHVLRENVVPPRLEAAIFRAMTRIPGVQLRPRVVDVLGRPALALGRTSGFLYEDLLLDRQTYAYLGELSRVVRDTVTDKVDGRPRLVKAGTEFVFARTAAAVVDRAGQRPTG